MKGINTFCDGQWLEVEVKGIHFQKGGKDRKTDFRIKITLKQSLHGWEVLHGKRLLNEATACTNAIYKLVASHG